ncbi:hypothetical protein [Antiquaquibacter soli]|uniref:Uncharacterized protein n=1 Tax=Antiquaquibacter soli TaxID=3064523 RepID=A0ABT9BP55_9MICO|nr:hypothetical protein [Protaetiibacter sp. WY-16]MDO7881200.1 hypothetical protein [Protaetiibacter sp. WY-16]
MTAEQPDPPSPAEEEVAPVVAVGRTVLGVVLVLVGLVLGIAGAIWYFVIPWFGWARTDIWYDLSEWADLGGAVVGIGGFIILIVGGALIQRARKKKLEIFMDASALVPSAEDRRTPPPAAPTPPPIV